MNKNKTTLTFQTRLELDEQKEKILTDFAHIMSKVERSLYADFSRGVSTTSCKNAYLKRFEITARHFNSCRVSLEGKISAYRASSESAIDSLSQKIAVIDARIKRLENKPSKNFSLHQKKRRRYQLQTRLTSMQRDKKEGRTHLCFGGKKMFRAQFNLEKNGYSTFEEWKDAWNAKRNSEFFLMGSKDETAGNQSCTATIQEDGKLQLRIRLPRAMEEKNGKYCVIKNVQFAYGHPAVLQALQNCSDRKLTNDIDMGQAISYRFKKDKKGWRVFISTEIQQPAPATREHNGAIGIDINADHIACMETDRYGNPIRRKKYSWSTYGKRKNRLKALTGDICKEIVEYAKKEQKPIVLEDLSFQKKKAQLEDDHSRRYARMLSSFAYSLFCNFLMARAYKHGVAVHKVNPAFTSIIGRFNYAKRYGLSIHSAAALCIARRRQRFSEAPCYSEGMIPDGKGGLVALTLPARNRVRHVWHFWGQVRRKLSTVLAAHFRAMKNRSLSPRKSTHETGNPRLLLV